MKNLKNTVNLIGFLGANPKVKPLGNNKQVARLSLATTESFKNKKGEKIDDTQWHNIVAWNRTAKFAEKFLQKGSHVAVEGKLVHVSYVDKNGVKRNTTEIVAHEFLLVG